MWFEGRSIGSRINRLEQLERRREACRGQDRGSCNLLGWRCWGCGRMRGGGWRGMRERRRRKT